MKILYPNSIMEDFRKKFQNLIAAAKLKDAFALAKKHIETHSNISEDVKNELITLELSYSSAAKRSRLGLTTDSEWLKNQNQIGFSLLELNFDEQEAQATAGVEPEEEAHVNFVSQMANKQNTINIMQTSIGVPELIMQKEKQKILFLASNSNSIGRLRLEREFLEINYRFQELLENFELKQGGDNVTTRTIQDFLLNENPHILHFAGHGTATATKEVEEGGLIIEEEKEGGLVLKTPSGEDRIVETDVLEDLFDILTSEDNSKLQIIVLNACFSKEQASVLCKHVPYVIGMKKEIGDLAAIEFSIGFYRGIAAGKSVETSFKLARNQMRLQGFEDDAHVPELLKK
ncbi:MAG: CHAT domain-containing protein [Bacteroidia bacterium]